MNCTNYITLVKDDEVKRKVNCFLLSRYLSGENKETDEELQSQELRLLRREADQEPPYTKQEL
jgi:hypothetical protein